MMGFSVISSSILFDVNLSYCRLGALDSSNHRTGCNQPRGSYVLVNPDIELYLYSVLTSTNALVLGSFLQRQDSVTDSGHGR
jgi:hypothetical protein